MSKLNSQFESLTKHTVFYYVDEGTLEHFKMVASEYYFYIKEDIPEQFKDYNMLFVICNIWLALQPKEKGYYLDEKRRMQYAAIYFQLDYVERNLILINFKTTCTQDNAQLFYFAYFTAVEMMKWLNKVMTRSEHQHLRDFYCNPKTLVAISPDEQSEIFHEVLDYQKFYMKEITINIQETTELESAVKIAVNKAREFFYVKNLIVKK